MTPRSIHRCVCASADKNISLHPIFLTAQKSPSFINSCLIYSKRMNFSGSGMADLVDNGSDKPSSALYKRSSPPFAGRIPLFFRGAISA